MNEEQARLLLERYRQGLCSEEESRIVESWISQELDNSKWDISYEAKTHFGQSLKNRIDMVRHAQLHDLEESNKKVKSLWPRIAIAASVIIALSAGSYFLIHKQQPVQQVAKNQIIVPGSKKAILTLSNGQQINLNDAKAGTLAQQGNTNVIKTADGQVIYNEQSKSGTGQEVIYNTITTPRGGYYPLKMADGTIAVLDAASSIKYPVSFTGKERLVEITGQVYFKVTHNAMLPFKLKVKGEVIEDLGTEFNVNAYDDEPYIRTTLVEGSVKVIKGQQSILLKPGQQAIAEQDKDNIRVKEVETQDVIAWKNGQTSFKNEDIKEIMRQVARWYDVDVEYQGDLPNTPFVGGISRNANLSDLLKILQFNDVHFTVEGKKITVKP